MKGEAFNCSLESRVSVIKIMRTIADVMETRFDPLIRADASHEMKDQTLSWAKAHAVFGWRPLGLLSRACEGNKG